MYEKQTCAKFGGIEPSELFFGGDLGLADAGSLLLRLFLIHQYIYLAQISNSFRMTFDIILKKSPEKSRSNKYKQYRKK